jgi:hypothetical protein
LEKFEQTFVHVHQFELDANENIEMDGIEYKYTQGATRGNQFNLKYILVEAGSGT